MSYWELVWAVSTSVFTVFQCSPASLVVRTMTPPEPWRVARAYPCFEVAIATESKEYAEDGRSGMALDVTDADPVEDAGELLRRDA